MFRVYYKDKKKYVNVYNVRDDTKTGYPQFLIYNENEWKYISAKHFIEVDGEKY